MLKIRYIISFILTASLFFGCANHTVAPTSTDVLHKNAQISQAIAFSVQVGSFKNPNNAWNFVDKLNKQGLDAFLFKHQKTYKVRFGNYTTKEIAIKQAQIYKKRGYYDDFFIVSPQHLAVNKYKRSLSQIQHELYESSYGYIGVPYKWGGMNEEGFDCSGLTYTIYRLNGISLPRTSLEQFKTGKKIEKQHLQVGDLVFFATKNKRINHVGIYVGEGKFIHAPSRGKTVREANLNVNFWKKAYRGSRRYI